MTAAIEAGRDAYIAIGLAGGVLLVLLGLLIVIGRSNLKAKEDSTMPLISVVKEAQSANRELTTEIVAEGIRRTIESKASIDALEAIAEELRENRKIQTGLADSVKTMGTDVQNAISDAMTESVNRQAKQHIAVIDAMVLSQTTLTLTLTDSQHVIVSELAKIITLAVIDIKAALALLMKRKRTQLLSNAIQQLNARLDMLTQEINSYAEKSHNPNPHADDAIPIPQLDPAVGTDAARPDPAGKYAWLLSDRRPNANGRYPDAAGWVVGGNRDKPSGDTG